LTLVPAERLRSWLEELFRALGAPEPAAAAVATSLWEAELAGHESHGVMRVLEYVQAIQAGTLHPAAEPEILVETPTHLHLECHGTFGSYAAHCLTEGVLAKARTQGLAAGALRGASHVGRLGDYPRKLATEGLLGLALANGGGKLPRVAPFGGRRAFLGTNPVAIAVPGPVNEPPIVVDFSTAAVASGKIRVLRDRGESLPPGWILDSQGRPSTAAEDYYADGMLLTAAAHKGYGLSLVADVLAGLVSGTGVPGLPGFSGHNGVFLLACHLEPFMPASLLGLAVADWARELRAVPALDPEQPVVLAGEPEVALTQRRLQEGVPLPEGLVARLAAVAQEHGLGAL